MGGEEHLGCACNLVFWGSLRLLRPRPVMLISMFAQKMVNRPVPSIPRKKCKPSSARCSVAARCWASAQFTALAALCELSLCYGVRCTIAQCIQTWHTKPLRAAKCAKVGFVLRLTFGLYSSTRDTRFAFVELRS